MTHSFGYGPRTRTLRASDESVSGVSQDRVVPPAPRALRLHRIDWRTLERNTVLVFGLVGVAICVLTLFLRIRTGTFGYDFRGSLWKAGKDILEGRSPYPAASASHLVHVGNAFVYPPLTALVSLPLAILPQTAAAILWSLLNLAALIAALWIVGLRDWRCYVLCLTSYPVLDNLFLGQLNGLLALAIALAWRFRHRAAAAGIAIGTAIALKLLAWPLLIWLLFTRRFKAAAICLATTVSLLLGSWAVIGFRGLAGYPHLLAADAEGFQNRSHSIVALALRAGFSQSAGRLAALLAAFVLLAIVWRETKAGATDDVFPFAAALLAGIVASPVVHSHYWVILFVPLAAAAPTVGWRWLLPLGFWISPVEDQMRAWQIAAMLALVSLLVLSMRKRRPRTSSESGREAAISPLTAR